MPFHFNSKTEAEVMCRRVEGELLMDKVEDLAGVCRSAVVCKERRGTGAPASC